MFLLAYKVNTIIIKYLVSFKSFDSTSKALLEGGLLNLTKIFPTWETYPVSNNLTMGSYF